MKEFLDYTKEELKIMYEKKRTLFEREGISSLTGLCLEDNNMPYERYIQSDTIQTFLHTYQQELVKVVEDVHQQEAHEEELQYDVIDDEINHRVWELQEIFLHLSKKSIEQRDELRYPVKLAQTGGLTTLDFSGTIQQLYEKIQRMFSDEVHARLFNELEVVLSDVDTWGNQDTYIHTQISFSLSSDGTLCIEIEENDFLGLLDREPFYTGHSIAYDEYDIYLAVKDIGYISVGNEFSWEESIIMDAGGWGSDEAEEYW